MEGEPTSLENALKRLHTGQGNPPSRSTLSTCLRHPSRRVIFLPCKRFMPGYPASQGEKTEKNSKAAFNVNCLW